MNLKYGGKDIKLVKFTGAVAESTKQMETKVMGGGGAVYGGNGATMPVTSVTTVHNDFFVIDESGREIAVSVENLNLPLRTGHIVDVVWGEIGNKKFYLYLNNHNLSQDTWYASGLHRLVGTCLRVSLVLGLIGSLVLAYIIQMMTYMHVMGTLSFTFIVITFVIIPITKNTVLYQHEKDQLHTGRV